MDKRRSKKRTHTQGLVGCNASLLLAVTGSAFLLVNIFFAALHIPHYHYISDIGDHGSWRFATRYDRSWLEEIKNASRYTKTISKNETMLQKFDQRDRDFANFKYAQRQNTTITKSSQLTAKKIRIRSKQSEHHHHPTKQEINLETSGIVPSDFLPRSYSDDKHLHVHAIPNFIIFTHHVNLLSYEKNNNDTDMLRKNLDNDDREELRVLAENVRNTIQLHPTSTVRFLTDDECVASIKRSGVDPELATFFVKEPRGMYKADICRGAALLETGGLYFDVDLHARLNVWTLLRPTTRFVTVRVHPDSNHHGAFFQAFMGATAGHPVVKRYLEMFVEYYRNHREVPGPLGVLLLRDAYLEFFGKGDRNGGDGRNGGSHDSPWLLSSSSANEVELWQEIRYHPKLFPNVKAPVGRRRACHFMVAIPWNHRTPPFYSRVHGSRMCGGKES